MISNKAREKDMATEAERCDYAQNADVPFPQDSTVEETGEADLGNDDDETRESCLESDDAIPSERAGNAARQALKRPARRRVMRHFGDRESLCATISRAQKTADFQEKDGSEACLRERDL